MNKQYAKKKKMITIDEKKKRESLGEIIILN